MRVPDRTDAPEQVHAIVARPEVLQNLVNAQFSIARSQDAQLQVNASQLQINASTLAALQRIALVAGVAALFSFGCLVAVLAK